MKRPRLTRPLLVAVFAACHSAAPTKPVAFKPSNFDANAAKPSPPGFIGGGSDSTGIPTFLWATRDGTEKAAAGADLETAARAHLVTYAPRYKVSADGMNATTLRNVHDTGEGAVIASFTQSVAGIEVFNHQLNVLMDRQYNLVAMGGNLSPHVAASTTNLDRLAFSVGVRDALAFAYNDLTGELLTRDAFVEETATDSLYRQFSLDPSSDAVNTLSNNARLKQVYYSQASGLEPAYYIELSVSVDTDSFDYGYVVSAKSGGLLFRKDQRADAGFDYTVWAEADGRPLDAPVGREAPYPANTTPSALAPQFQTPRTLSMSNYPFSKNDPWLPDNAQNTFGNNAEAYADLNAPDGFSPGDVMPTLAGAGSFARTYDVTQSPQVSTDQIMAATTSQFYVVNFLHDWYYDSGFDEAAGNAQLSNFGRGGIQGDPLHAEAQDYSGLNNANMSTPADGKSPRMQMYVFSGLSTLHANLTAPAAIAGAITATAAAFGPSTLDFSGDIVLVDDGTSPSADGCQTPFANAAAVAGHVALIQRGTCAFSVKANNAQAAGASALLVFDSKDEAPFVMGSDATTKGITIPSVMTTLATGSAIAQQLSAGQTVSLTLKRAAPLDRDGTIDNTIIAHEWGHYISNRLIGNGSGLLGNMQGGLGEGWADFHALLFTTRAEDAQIAGNENFEGSYGLAGYVMSGPETPNYYFGIRRVPYSVDFSKDPLTYTDMQQGVALPDFAPLAFGQDGSSNSEVHSTGEVWATMLWECYVSLLQQTVGASPRMTFDQAREKMKRYIVAAYKVTPINPTVLEARDAVLAAAYANDPVDYVLFSAAFARRGAGLRAVSPDAFSPDNVGIVESFATGNDVQFVSASLAETKSACPDGVLDNGDTGTITVTVRNVGTGLLSATHATLTSNFSGLTFANGGVIHFSSMEPFGTATGTVDVTLSGATDITQLDFSIAVSDPTLAIPGDVPGLLSVRANYDDVPNQSATDDVESTHVAWSLQHDTSLGAVDWQRLELDATHHVLLGQDPGQTADLYLVSPALNVAPGGDFSFTFQQAYSFETDAGPPITYFDGGVIEISTDGFNWTDVGATAAGYNVTLYTDDSTTNPIKGRQAFGGETADFPTLGQATTIDLGTTYAGQSVKIRFRVGSDPSGAGVGWLLDNLAFNGISNTPFSAIVADRGCQP